MSNAIPVRTIVNAVVTAVNTAWYNPNLDIGNAQTRQNLPYARVWWDKPQVSFTGPTATLTNVNQTIKVHIMGRFQYPLDYTLNAELIKADQANALIALLQTGPNFAGIGVLPLVTEIDPDEQDPPGEGTYEIQLTFECQVQGNHH
jgi:hypothetical protein